MKKAKRSIAMLLSAAMILTGVIPALAETMTNTEAVADVPAEQIEQEQTGVETENTGMAAGIEAAEASEAVSEETDETGGEAGTEGVDAECSADPLLSGAAKPIYETEVVFDGSNWMSELDPNIPLSKITVPGSHDAGTFNIRFGAVNKLTGGLVDEIEGWLINHLPKNSFLTNVATRAVEFISGGAVLAVVNEIGELIQRLAGRCQSLSIKEQLAQGVRSFDLRFRYEDGNFNVYHGDMTGVKGFFLTCECYDEYGKRLTLEKVFQDISAFLAVHDKETVFVTLKNEGGTYDKNTEIQLYTLEKKYGVETRFANRSFSRAVMKELEEEKEASYYDVNDPANTLGNFRLQIVDVSGSVKNAVSGKDVREVTKNKTGDEWVVTPGQKLTLFGNSLKAPQNRLEERQTNVQVKFIIKMDPMDECEFRIVPVITELRLFWFLPKLPVVTGFTVDIDALLKTPLSNAKIINPAVKTMLKDYVRNSGHEGNGLGIILSDFVKEDLARAVADVNRTTGYGPVFTESTTEVANAKTLGSDGTGDGGTDDWRKEYEELEAITELSADFTGSYRLITENGYEERSVSYDEDGNLVFETKNDAVKMINICMDGVSIPLDYLHVYAPVTAEYPQAKITVFKSYLRTLSPGSHSFVVFFTDGSEAALVVIPERISERAAEPEEKASFTGTWEAPVSGGRWYTDPAGNWHYENGGVFKDTWGYIVNPDAGGKAQWFLFGTGGELLSGWQQVNGKWYYLNPSHDGSFGACFMGPGRTPDGYEVDASGAWTGR